GGVAGIELMENAGRAVADRLSATHSPTARVAVVAGPGNNGGDGFVAARLLRERGYQVRLLLLGEMSRLKGDAALAAQRWAGPSEPAAPEALGPADAIVDALFGAGLDRPVAGAAAAIIAAINAARCPIYAVDLPSGINGTAGLVTIASPRDALAVNAAASLAVMVRAVDGAAELAEFFADARRNVAVLGPGGGVGQDMREQVRAALAGARPVVLDADALTSFAGEPQTLAAAIRARAPAAAVLTPHAGEFRRLFGEMDKFNQPMSKLEKTHLAAKETGAIVLLKGPDTVVAAPDGRAAIAENAPSWLATAGAGDALGRPRLDRQRVDPERLPAVVEAVEQAGAVTVQVDDLGKVAAVGQRQHHDAAAADRE